MFIEPDVIFLGVALWALCIIMSWNEDAVKATKLLQCFHCTWLYYEYYAYPLLEVSILLGKARGFLASVGERSPALHVLAMV